MKQGRHERKDVWREIPNQVQNNKRKSLKELQHFKGPNRKQMFNQSFHLQVYEKLLSSKAVSLHNLRVTNISDALWQYLCPDHYYPDRNG